jgi:hypothetical protein
VSHSRAYVRTCAGPFPCIMRACGTIFANKRAYVRDRIAERDDDDSMGDGMPGPVPNTSLRPEFFGSPGTPYRPPAIAPESRRPSGVDSSRDRAPVGLHVTLLPKTNQRSTRCRVRSAVRTGWLGSFKSEIVCAAPIFADAPALAQTLRMRESSDGEYAR